MSIPLTAMTQTLTAQLLLSSPPERFPLSHFCNWVQQTPEFADAPVRQVECIRSRVHEYILLSCEVTLSTTQSMCTVWLRIERHPSQSGVNVILNKPVAAVDTVQVSTNSTALLDPMCNPRGRFAYTSTNGRSTKLQLRHIAEMCGYFVITDKSSKYAVLKTNCRWICYLLLECLRDCQPCYGGEWIGPRSERAGTTDTQTALEVKAMYLQAKHTSCCGRNYSRASQYSAVGALMAAPNLASAMANPHNNINETQNSATVTSAGVLNPTPQPSFPSIPQSARPPPSNRGDSFNHFPQHTPNIAPSGFNYTPLGYNAGSQRNSMAHLACQCSNCHPLGQMHARHNAPDHAQQSRTWQNSAYLPSQCNPSLQVDAHPGGMNNHQACTSSTQTRNDTADSCRSCGTCGSMFPPARNIAHRRSLQQSHLPQAHVHTRIPSSSGLHHANPSYNYQQQARHSPYHVPNELYSISEQFSHLGLVDDQHANNQHSSGPNLGRCPCSECLNRPIRQHGQFPIPPQGAPNHIHPHMPSLDLNASPYHPHQDHHPVMSGVPADIEPLQQPQPGRQWTQTVWRDQGYEAPLRTDSPKAFETPLTNNPGLWVQQSPTLSIRMPEADNYV